MHCSISVSKPNAVARLPSADDPISVTLRESHRVLLHLMGPMISFSILRLIPFGSHQIACRAPTQSAARDAIPDPRAHGNPQQSRACSQTWPTPKRHRVCTPVVGHNCSVGGMLPANSRENRRRRWHSSLLPGIFQNCIDVERGRG